MKQLSSPVTLSLAFLLAIRLIGLGSFPGFEYDEGTAALLAVKMLRGEAGWLLGEKIYRGPIYEWLIVPFLGLPLEWASRLPAALLGWGTLLLLAHAMRSWPSRLAAMTLLAIGLQPWFLATSRVAHSACIVPFWFVAAWSLARRQRGLEALGAGVCLGLAFHGHLYALVLLPAFVFYQARHLHRAALVVGWTLGASPLLLANIFNLGASFRVFLSGHEGHLVTGGIERYLLRYAGHPFSALLAWEGSHSWLDTADQLPGGIPLSGFLGVYALLAGFYFAFRAGWKPWREFTGIAFILVLATVPLVTKGEGIWPPWLPMALPTYLDLTLPLLVLLWLGAIECLLETHEARVRTLLTLQILANILFLVFRVGPTISDGGFGRWRVPWQKMARQIEALEPTQLSASIAFPGVAPQLRAWFPDVPFLPSIFDVPAGREERAEILFIHNSMDGELRVPPAKRIPLVGGWEAWRYQSPGLDVYVKGSWGEVQFQGWNDDLDRDDYVLGPNGHDPVIEADIRTVIHPSPLEGKQLFLGPVDLDTREIPLSHQVETYLKLKTVSGLGVELRLSPRPNRTVRVATPDGAEITCSEVRFNRW